MVDSLNHYGIPIPENILRQLQKNVSHIVPRFDNLEQTQGLKELNIILEPLLATANVADLPAGHRAAACNTLCAIVEFCQSSKIEYARHAALDDSVWFGLLKIFLERSDNAKAKSVRQVLLVITGAITKTTTTRTLYLQERATSVFLEIICQRQDRLKVKSAIQGLAHFLAKEVVTLAELVGYYRDLIGSDDGAPSDYQCLVLLFRRFLGWILHSDTAPSAGHLLKNFLHRLRQSSPGVGEIASGEVSPLWIRPVVDTAQSSLQGLQELKTHVFPHCFLPEIDEYLRFLSYLHFRRHLAWQGPLPDQLGTYEEVENELTAVDELNLLLAAIEVGKELGFVEDQVSGSKLVEVSEGKLKLPNSLFGAWVPHPEPGARLAGIFLSIHSTAITRPIPREVFQALKKNLVHLHGDTDANYRSEILSLTQRLFDRLRASTATLVKSKPGARAKNRIRISTKPKRLKLSSYDGDHKEQQLETHLEFITWYIGFLAGELRPTASYQRHTTALKSLLIVMRSGLDSRVQLHDLSKQAQGELRWVHDLQILRPRLVRLLLDLTVNAFDDVRNGAATLLALDLKSIADITQPNVLSKYSKFIERAEAMMFRSGRADQADGVARSYSLLFSEGELARSGTQTSARTAGSTVFHRLIEQLEETISVARQDLSHAVNGRPVHGILSALRYIIDQPAFYSEISTSSEAQLVTWRHLHDRICDSFEDLWQCIQPILTNDAPEGYIPSELEEETTISTKEISSYCWRGMKEASILLRSMILNAPLGSFDSSMVSIERFEKLGNLCFSQLAELRHRGAFATVAQTFAVFCRRCMTTKDDRLRELPNEWYKETLLCIEAKSSAITRRSGGIPAMMTAIVCAEPQAGATLLPRAMRDLTVIASQSAEESNIEDSRLPQVHAMNCIKELFTTSKLSAVSEAYIGNGLDLAARMLNSKVWPVRNCGLMLFKALIERLLGSSEAQDWKEKDRAKTSRFSYNNYPNLVGILMVLLESKPQTFDSDDPRAAELLDLHGAEGVFPALQILQQASPPETNRAEVTELVIKLTSGPHWHLRDMAARTFVSLKHRDEYTAAISMLVSTIETETRHNHRHGLLLCLKYTVRKFLQGTDAHGARLKDEYLAKELNSLQDQAAHENCPATKAIVVDIINTWVRSIFVPETVAGSDEQVWKPLSASLIQGDDASSSTAAGGIMLRTSVSQRGLLLGIVADDDTNEKNTGRYLPWLTDDDADTCIATLGMIQDIIEGNHKALSFSKPDLLVAVHKLLLCTCNPEVLSKAQLVMASALSNPTSRRAFFENMHGTDVATTLEKLELQCLEGSPSNMQSALHLLGFFLDQDVCKDTASEDPLRCMMRYVRLLRMMIEDTNAFDTRFAAAQSLSTFEMLWVTRKRSSAFSAIILAFSFIIYDLLSDDDDEIRDLAAPVAAKLMCGQSPDSSVFGNVKHSVPIVTTQRLVKWLAHQYPGTGILCKEALCRLTDTRSSVDLFSHDFAAEMAAARQEDTALFIREKQNLFKDDTLDALLWSHLVSSLSPSAIPAELATRLTKWVLDGLSCLTETAKIEMDGALGWTSKSEVFVLGMRVILGAEVLLKWSAKSVHGIENKACDVRKALAQLAEAGAESDLHGLWMEKIEAVLEDAVVAVLRGVHGTLKSFGRSS